MEDIKYKKELHLMVPLNTEQLQIIFLRNNKDLQILHIKSPGKFEDAFSLTFVRQNCTSQPFFE